jgi:transcriptional regulator with XRE-family HTH domain
VYEPTLFYTIRKHRGLKLEALVPDMGLCMSTLSRKERGLSAWTIDEAKQAALLLDVSLGVLLGLDPLVIESASPAVHEEVA